MENRELYRATFSQLRTHVEINDVKKEAKTMKANHTLRRTVALAAAVVLLCVLATTAMALNLLGLRDLIFPQRTTLHVPVPSYTQRPDGERIVDGFLIEERSVDMISLQGYTDAPENRACVEWNLFYDEYISQHQFDNSIFDPDGRYSLYSVYDQVMADKLDEIAAKYDLSLHQKLIEIPDRAGWLDYFGPTFLSPGNHGGSGYRYDDGACSFDGAADVADYGSIDYQFHYAKKGVLDTVALNIGNLSDYQEREYETAAGVSVKLSLGPERSLIWADTQEGFLLINVLSGTQGDDLFSSGPIGERELEALADLFDFSLLP